MIQNKYKKIAFFAILLTLSFGIGLKYYFKRVHDIRLAQLKIRLSPQEQEKNYQTTLSNPKASDYEKMKAMTYLAVKQDPKVHDLAIAGVDSTSTEIKYGSIRSLGRYNDAKTLDTFHKLILVPQMGIRINAIEALGVSKSPEKEKLLKNLLSKPGISDTEKLAAYLSLMRQAENPKEQKASQSKLLKLAQNSKEEGARSYAFSHLIMYLGNDARVVSMAKTIVKERMPKDSLMLAERYLARQAPSIQGTQKRSTN